MLNNKSTINNLNLYTIRKQVSLFFAADKNTMCNKSKICDLQLAIRDTTDKSSKLLLTVPKT